MKIFYKGLAILTASLLFVTGCASKASPEQESSEASQSTQASPEETAPETNAAEDQAASSEKVFKIGVVQYAKHPALDAAREGFLERLDELGIQYEEDFQDAQGDQSNLKTIAQRFVNNDVDLILAIATKSVQAMVEETKDIPILGTAVTDYEEVNLVDNNENPGGNVSGTSDMSPIDQQIQLITQMKPDTKTLGIVYTSSEANSIVQVDLAKAEAEKLGLAVEETAITVVGDLQQAAQTLVGKVDAIFVPTDNIVASAIQTLADVTDAAKVPVVGGEENQVAGGATATIGLNYHNLGRQTADMAKRILLDGEAISQMPIETAKEMNYAYNKQSIQATEAILTPELENGTAY